MLTVYVKSTFISQVQSSNKLKTGLFRLQIHFKAIHFKQFNNYFYVITLILITVFTRLVMLLVFHIAVMSLLRFDLIEIHLEMQ